MKKSHDYQWAVWLIILVFAILASSCTDNMSGHRPTLSEKVTLAKEKAKKVYPYEWDTITYTQLQVGDVTTDNTIHCIFNEEYVDIGNRIITDGVWVNTYTFESPLVRLLISPATLEFQNPKTGQTVYRLIKL